MCKLDYDNYIMCTYMKMWYRLHTLHWRHLPLESEQVTVVLPFTSDWQFDSSQHDTYNDLELLRRG